jgi:hypothetical protein
MKHKLLDELQKQDIDETLDDLVSTENFIKLYSQLCRTYPDSPLDRHKVVHMVYGG